MNLKMMIVSGFQGKSGQMQLNFFRFPKTTYYFGNINKYGVSQVIRRVKQLPEQNKILEKIRKEVGVVHGEKILS